MIFELAFGAFPFWDLERFLGWCRRTAPQIFVWEQLGMRGLACKIGVYSLATRARGMICGCFPACAAHFPVVQQG